MVSWDMPNGILGYVAYLSNEFSLVSENVNTSALFNTYNLTLVCMNFNIYSLYPYTCTNLISSIRNNMHSNDKAACMLYIKHFVSSR